MKTNAVRLLEKRGVAHELRTYDVDPDDLSAETVAAKIGLPAARYSSRRDSASFGKKTTTANLPELDPTTTGNRLFLEGNRIPRPWKTTQ